MLPARGGGATAALVDTFIAGSSRARFQLLTRSCATSDEVLPLLRLLLLSL